MLPLFLSYMEFFIAKLPKHFRRDSRITALRADWDHPVYGVLPGVMSPRATQTGPVVRGEEPD